MEIKNFTLKDETYTDSGEHVIYEYGGPMFTIGMDFPLTKFNYAWRSTNATAYRVQSQGSIVQADGLLHVGTVGDYYHCYQINNDGSLTDLGKVGEYINVHCFAVDTVRKWVFFGHSSYSGIQVADYSPCLTGGAPTYLGKLLVADGLTFDRCGLTPTNGYALAGDYLYTSWYSTTPLYTVLHRIHVPSITWSPKSATQETISIYGRSGSGSRHRFIYYPSLDWVTYAGGYSAARSGVIVNASKSLTDPVSPCEAFECDLNAIGLGAFPNNMFTIPHDDNPNRLIVGGSQPGEWGIADMTAVFAKTATDPVWIKGAQNGYYLAPARRNWALYSRQDAVRHPVHGTKFVVAGGYIDYGALPTVLDEDNERWYTPAIQRYYYDKDENIVYRYKPDGDMTDTSGGMQYFNVPELIESPNGTKFWLIADYLALRIYTWPAATVPFEYHASGYVAFGPFALDSGANIYYATVSGFTGNVFKHAETAVVVELSNNGGETWEEYDYAAQAVHEFSSAGAVGMMRISLTGYGGYKAPYISGSDPLVVTVIGIGAGSVYGNPRYTFER